LLACLIGFFTYFESETNNWDWLFFLFEVVFSLAMLAAVLAIPFALFRYLWRAGSRMKG
jgi:hypothetical protein